MMKLTNEEIKMLQERMRQVRDYLTNQTSDLREDEYSFKFGDNLEYTLQATQNDVTISEPPNLSHLSNLSQMRTSWSLSTYINADIISEQVEWRKRHAVAILLLRQWGAIKFQLLRIIQEESSVLTLLKTFNVDTSTDK